MNRRTLLRALSLATLVGGGAFSQSARLASPKSKDVEELQRNWKELLNKKASIAANADPIAKSDEEWRKLLPEPAYVVLRHEGTEHPFSSPLNDEHRPGIFVCAGCALPLFSSAMKFDSGTGWPSFFTTIPGAFATKVDNKIIYPRTEYHCAKCGGHHGHLFDDGPAPTGQRWCSNGVALRFIWA